MDKILSCIKKYQCQNSAPNIGIYGMNLTTKKTVQYHADDVFGTASVIKVMIALTLFVQAEAGKINIDSPLKITDYPDVFQVGKYINGALAFFPKDATVTLRMACFFMLHLSDNPATNFILKFVSQKDINAYIRQLGYKHTELTTSRLDPMLLEKEKNHVGITTAQEMADVFGKIIHGDFLKNKKNVEDIKKMLEADYPEKTYSRYLPVTWNVSDQNVKIKKIYVKNGSFPAFELRTESLGMITDKDEVIIMSVYTQGLLQKNGEKYPTNLQADHPAVLFIAEITKMLFDALY